MAVIRLSSIGYYHSRWIFLEKFTNIVNDVVYFNNMWHKKGPNH